MTSAHLSAHPAHTSVRHIGWSAALLGFGLGGFFDGILLHQVLQWHHLLSAIAPDETAADLRTQILADGLFHVFTYVVTAIGLLMLWQRRQALAAAGQGPRLAAQALIGFGVWNIVDAALFHWLLGIHRIRMDTENPLLWDIAWLVPFGIVPALAGWWLLRRPPEAGTGGGGSAVALSLAALAAGFAALAPPAGADDDRSLAIFRSDMGFPAIVAAAEAAGGRPVWSDAAGGVWLIAFEPGARPWKLYRHGAMLVSGGPIAVGCLSWSDV